MAIRRSLLMMQESPQPQAGYVTDGLVFWLDGIDKGTDNTKWIDRIGSKEIGLTNCTFGTDYVDFATSGAYGYLSGQSTGVTPANGTIEVCVSSTDSIFRSRQYVLLRGKNDEIMLYYNGSASKFAMSKDGNDVSYTHSLSSFYNYTASLSQARGYMNGTALTSTTGSYYIPSITSSCIIVGAYNTSAGTRFAGRLHSIRVYNKQLTEAEVLQNQRYDNTRFNLGLTI